MAKRLTDTEKWKDDWYVSLNNDYRIIWQWLIDNCSHAGFCKRSMGVLNLMCRTSIEEEQLMQEMKGRIIIHHNEWFIPGFLKFQYPTLHSQKPVIVSVVKELFKKNATELIPKLFGNDYIIIAESFANHYEMIKNKDKNKDKNKSKSKDVIGGVGEEEWAEDNPEPDPSNPDWKQGDWENFQLEGSRLPAEMMEIFVASFPEYPDQGFKDTPACWEIAYQLAGYKKRKWQSVLNGGMEMLLQDWREIVAWARGDPWYSTKPISYWNEDFQGLIQSKTNGKGKGNFRTARDSGLTATGNPVVQTVKPSDLGSNSRKPWTS